MNQVGWQKHHKEKSQLLLHQKLFEPLMNIVSKEIQVTMTPLIFKKKKIPPPPQALTKRL